MARANSKKPPDILRIRFRRALSASVVAHARYLATQGEKSVSPRQLAQQKIAWLSMEARKARIQAKLVTRDPKQSD
jgi:hypothetical protein